MRCHPDHPDIPLLTATEAAAMRAAGRVAAQTLAHAGRHIRAGITTRFIDGLVRKDTERRGAVPAQLGYHGFPASVCTSRNHVVCHGIPSRWHRLKAGDIVNIDVTSRFGGFHGDTSRTFFVGRPGAEARHVVETAQRCLLAGIEAARPGRQLGEIGLAIVATATAAGCSVVADFGGHGIGREMHLPPHVDHTGATHADVVLLPGMALTIEPMVNLGAPDVAILDDGWTVVTADGSLSAQFEHTLLVTEDGVEITTQVA